MITASCFSEHTTASGYAQKCCDSRKEGSCQISGSMNTSKNLSTINEINHPQNVIFPSMKIPSYIYGYGFFGFGFGF